MSHIQVELKLQWVAMKSHMSCNEVIDGLQTNYTLVTNELPTSCTTFQLSDWAHVAANTTEATTLEKFIDEVPNRLLWLATKILHATCPLQLGVLN